MHASRQIAREKERESSVRPETIQLRRHEAHWCFFKGKPSHFLYRCGQRREGRVKRAVPIKATLNGDCIEEYQHPSSLAGISGVKMSGPSQTASSADLVFGKRTSRYFTHFSYQGIVSCAEPTSFTMLYHEAEFRLCQFSELGSNT